MISGEDILLKRSISPTTTGSATTPLALVDNLPPEILSYIFILSKTYCQYDVTVSAPARHNAFSEVSVYWRRIAVNTPALWTHVDIAVSGHKTHHYKSALLGLSRSGSLLIHFHFNESNDGYDNSTSDSETHQLTTLLTPYLSRTGTLDIGSESSSAHLVDSILGFWVDNGAPGPTKTLSVYRPLGDDKEIGPDRTPASAYQIKSPERFEDVLLHLRTLRLQNTIFHWDSAAYRDLVELQLDSALPGSLIIPISKLATILSYSPRLMTLKLGGLIIGSSGDCDTSTTVRLEALEVLNVIRLERQSLRLLFSLLYWPNCAAKLSVGMSFSNHADPEEAAQAFFIGTAITTLYLAGPSIRGNPQQRFPVDFSRLPNVECLALYRYALAEQTPLERSLETLDSIQLEGLHRQSSCEIYLVRCRFDIQSLVSLINTTRARVIHIECCSLFVDGANPSEPRTVQSATELLSRRCPDLDLLISQTDTTLQWPCRTIFSYPL